MKYMFSRLIVTIGLAGGAAAALGHHSTAMFDYSKTETVTGVIKDFQWSNPHCYIQVLVPSSRGGDVEWSIEGGTPTSMTRMGWSRASLKPGDQVTVAFAPMRDGQHAGTVKTVTLPDGKVLNGMAGIIPASGEGKGTPAPPLPSLERATPKQAASAGNDSVKSPSCNCSAGMGTCRSGSTGSEEMAVLYLTADNVPSRAATQTGTLTPLNHFAPSCCDQS